MATGTDIQAIRKLLDRVRLRERSLNCAWILARVLSVITAIFLLCCGIDWVVDLYQDTPKALRWTMFAVQGLLWAGGVIWLISGMILRRSDDEVALQVEDRITSLGHRLISAVQFAKPDAKTEGMSHALIEAVTHQAGDAAEKITPAEVCDSRRLKWATWAILPLVLLTGGLIFAAPATWQALAARQFLTDVEIPRSIQFATTTPIVWPSGEDNYLQIEVNGPIHEETTGIVRIDPKESPSFRVALQFEKKTETGALYTAHVPAGDTSFQYRAWLGDGRLHKPGEVRYEARPVITSISAWVQYPTDIIGKRADGNPYEEPQRSGDVVYRLPGSQLRLKIATQIPVTEGEILLRGSQAQKLPLRIEGDAIILSKPLTLTPEMTGYEVVVRNSYGFENLEKPRRTIRKLPIEPPEVALLPETQYRRGDPGTPEDYETEGIPVAEGSPFRIDYRCGSRYGLSHAQVRYRVIPRSRNPEEDSGKIDREGFLSLPLGPTRGHKGPISKEAMQEFYTLPAGTPEAIPGTEGGGGYNFKITGIPDGKGGLMRLVEGDRIQFYIEVYSKADPEGTPGRSAIREKEVVSRRQLTNWLMRKDDLKEKTRLLEEQQRGARPGIIDP